MSPRIDISIDELPEASGILDGHDYSSQIIQRIAGTPVILDVSGCPGSHWGRSCLTSRLRTSITVEIVSPGPSRATIEARPERAADRAPAHGRTSLPPRGPVRASRRGDARLKSLLIFSCNSLVRSSGRYGEYYRACRARGMGHGRALKAVARKRLRAIYAVMRDRVPYRE